MAVFFFRSSFVFTGSGLALRSGNGDFFSVFFLICRLPAVKGRKREAYLARFCWCRLETPIATPCDRISAVSTIRNNLSLVFII